jgi:hypothetical protein
MVWSIEKGLGSIFWYFPKAEARIVEVEAKDKAP